MATTGNFWNLADPDKPTGIKDPDATLDFPVDWSAWLADIGDTIASYEIVTAAPIVIVAPRQLAGVVTFFAKGGVVGTTYGITVRVTTSSTPPRVDDRTVYLKIQER